MNFKPHILSNSRNVYMQTPEPRDSQFHNFEFLKQGLSNSFQEFQCTKAQSNFHPNLVVSGLTNQLIYITNSSLQID